MLVVDSCHTGGKTDWKQESTGSTELRFSRLRLNGFKSFVDPTEMVIADGLTGVVGPNGCGKSNLLEALRWVMGENRPTAMRGDGMEDVIFAGTASRPARNFAEVALAIDNSDRLAPAGFNDSDLLDVVRRITRDAGSAYKANSKDVRARDVQMLFADASTGAHSPALVRQGQIAELINARPKARRRILEEAAGISGLYQRRHEAELKLKGAETNLARVDDVLEQLANQLQTLARQARQAARYREIGEELRKAEGQLLFLRWREADVARLAADTRLTEAARSASEAERLARAATSARGSAEEALPPLREEAAIAASLMQRLALERQSLQDQEARAKAAIRALTGRIEQMSRDIERETTLNSDAGETIGQLEREEAELSDAGEGYEDHFALAQEEAQDASKVLTERESAFTQLTEDVARLAARHQSAQRRRDDAQTTLEKSQSEAERVRSSVAEASEGLDACALAFDEASQRQADAAKLAEETERSLASADEAFGQAQAREADARAQKSEADGEVAALKAEVAALSQLVERDTGENEQLMDKLNVKSGYEKALGAALADDLKAPIIDQDDMSGWAGLPGYSTPQTLPEGVAALSNMVSVPDILVRRIGQIGLVDSKDGPRLQKELLPGQRLVSEAGDLWRWDGYRARASDAPSVAALRLQQLNRLQELKQDMEEASAKALGAAQAHSHLQAELSKASDEDANARKARRDADAAMAEASRAMSKNEADRDIARGRLESLKLAVARHDEAAGEARQELSAAEAAFSDLEHLDTARAEAEDVRTTVEAARLTMIAKRSALDELRRDHEERVRRKKEVSRELNTWRTRLETAGLRLGELEERRLAAKTELQNAESQPAEIEKKRAELDSAVEGAGERDKLARDALAVGETALADAVSDERAAEREASDAREDRARADALAKAAQDRVAAAALRIGEDLDTTPEELANSLEVDPEQMPSADAIDTTVQRLRRQRDGLGAVNLRAEEDAREVQTEHDTLESEKADLEAAIRALRTGIASLNKEGRERLLTAFEQVNTNFGMLFSHLFGGGEAKLVMVESDDPLEAGLEIMCQPPGKKLSTLSLLSGGEQTLTALA